MVEDPKLAGILEKLGKLSTSAVSDALDKLGIDGVLMGFNQIVEGSKIVGQAFTVKETPVFPNSPPFSVEKIIDRASPEDVVVIDVEGKIDVSTWGGNASLAAKMKKIQGVVINGACRDVEEIRQTNFPVFSISKVPRNATGRIATVDFNIPLQINRIAINPADIVMFDETGGVVIPRNRLDDLMIEVKKVEDRDEFIRNRLEAGVSMSNAKKEASGLP